MRKLMALTALIVMLLGACGGGDDDNNGENASAQSDTTEAAASGDFDSGRFCGARAGFEALNQSATPDANALKSAAENMDKLADYAPSEIKADVRTVADASKPFFELLASVNYDFTKLMSDQSKAQEFQEIGAKMADEKVKAASERITAWVQAHCK